MLVLLFSVPFVTRDDHLGRCGRDNEPQRVNTYRLTCDPSEDSSQPAHQRSQIRVLVVRLIKRYPSLAIKNASGEVSDQTAQMLSMI